MPVGWAIAVVVLFVAVVVLAVIVLGLLRQMTPLLEEAAARPRIELSAQGPAIGTPLPHFSALGPDGEVTDEVIRGRPAVLLFLSQGCGPCETLAGELGRAALDGLDGRLVVVTTASDPGELGIPAQVPVLTEPDRAVSRALSVAGAPFAVAVDSDGIVTATGVANSVAQLAAMAAGAQTHP